MLSTNEMEGNIGVGDAIYGPLLKVLKICALRLHIPPPTFNEANERKKLKSWAKVIFFWFIGVLILYRCIVLAINQYILMEDVNLMGVNAIQLTASLLSLTGFLLIYFWQRGEFLKSFPTEIELATRLKALKSTEKGRSYLRPWHTFWLISLVTTLAITAATEVVLVGEKPILSHDRLREGTLQYISILLFIPNLFIQFWSVVCAVCSIALLSLLHKAILSELSYFNDEIVEAAANGQLLHVDLLINYASRHLDILIICDIFNRRINIFISAWILLSLSAIIFNAISFFTSISNWSTAILCILLITIWAINMGIVVGNCFSLYTQIHRTRYLLLYEKNIWENANEKICFLLLL
uniref:Secreted protein n=1 Tax=Parascaris univalens TaxID=6257 RepID=A0A915ARI2_PARUN